MIIIKGREGGRERERRETYGRIGGRVFCREKVESWDREPSSRKERERLTLVFASFKIRSAVSVKSFFLFGQ